MTIKTYPSKNSNPTEASNVTGTDIGSDKRGLDVFISGVSSETVYQNYMDDWESEVVTVQDNAAVEITPMENQVFIRIVPLVAGNFRYNFTNAVLETNSEAITSTSPISINTATSIFLRRDAASGSGNVVVYKGAKLP